MNHNAKNDYKLAALFGVLLLISQNSFAHPAGQHDYAFFAALAHSIEHIYPLAFFVIPLIAAAVYLWQNRRAN